MKDGSGRYRSVEIATPLGDVAFRFVERTEFPKFAPGFVDSGVGNAGQPKNIYGIRSIDHVTANGLTMQPIVAWYRDVLGFEPFWDISFHTKDVASEVARTCSRPRRTAARASARSSCGIRSAT